MQRNFDNKDFEQFLKQNADQYRMYPSEKVWKEIHNSLHSRRRWAVGIASSLLLITGAIVTWMMLLNPSTDKNTVTLQTKPTTIASPPVEKTSQIKNTVPILDVANANRSGVLNKIPSIMLETATEPESSDLAANNLTSVSGSLHPTPVKEELISENNTVDILSKTNISLFAITDRSEKNVVIPFKSPKATLSLKQLPISSLIISKPTIASQKITKRRKLDLQLYFTPGISYRRLTENKEAIAASSSNPTPIPANFAVQDVKRAVKHKPDIGFELGLATRYHLSNRLIVKAGLQFNVNKYDIRAFSYYVEPATIAIQGDPSQRTITRLTSYRNSSGYKPSWLTNVYFSLSMPVGAELKILDGKKIDLGFGVTAQPTYLLDNRAYMISTDFKNYVKVPDLIRRWNFNTGAELIVGIGTKSKWQIGPQVRYQALSSFKDKYPVKENLFNFGLKVGVILNQ